MNTAQTSHALRAEAHSPARRRLRLRRTLLLIATLLTALALLGCSSLSGVGQTYLALDTLVGRWNWNLVGWEFNALAEKVHSQIQQPARNLDPAERSKLVLDYLARARLIGSLEGRINGIYGDDAQAHGPELTQLLARVAVQGDQNELIRPAVEQVLQDQVSAQLAKAGLRVGANPIPPVLFTFTEPPKKLVVSPRSRIATVYYAMLDPKLPADQREAMENQIFQDAKLSAYVTNIGGLGAYPTLVVDRAPIDWVLSTVAHEWTHNYLTFFPLGINYDTSPDLMILNETVADIVGDEIGREALWANYPLQAEAAYEDRRSQVDRSARPSFDFNKEMRQTRQVTDLFLKLGRVQDAEEYMNIRRILFRENGYNLRKLNQAYFAFHGNYGTGAAATSPIGPKLERLRALSPDLKTFLETVRWFTSAADLDKALEHAQAG